MPAVPFQPYGALAHAAAWDRVTPEQRPKYLESVLDYHRQVRVWAEVNPETFEDRAALVGAAIAGIGAGSWTLRQLQRKSDNCVANPRLNPADPAWLVLLAAFAAIRCARVPSDGATISVMHAARANDFLEPSFGNLEGARQSLNLYELEIGKKPDTSAESMVESVQGEHVKTVAAQIPFLQASVKRRIS